MYARTNGMNPAPCPAREKASPRANAMRKVFRRVARLGDLSVSETSGSGMRRNLVSSSALCACFVNQNYVTFCIRCRSMDVINTVALDIYSAGAACEPSNG